MTTKPSLAGPAAVIMVSLALAGCGAQPFPQAEVHPPASVPAAPAVAQTPKARLLASVQRATAAKTARLALHMRLGGGDEEGLTFDGTGVIDLGGQKMDLKLQTQEPGFHEGADEIRIVDRVAYVDQGGTWTSLPIDGNFALVALPDPTSYLDLLQGVADDVRVDGHEPLRGIDTTRYMATVDLARAVARTSTSPAERAVVQNVQALFGDLRIPVTVWLDATGRLRKLNLSMDLSADATKLGISQTAKLDATVEFYDFGVPVSVSAPKGAIDAAVAARALAAQSDLRNALTAEKTTYTDNETYTADASLLRQIEPSLDWGGKLTVVVGNAGAQADQVVCVSERSASGVAYALADVAAGPYAGTYYGKAGCPAIVTEQNVSTLGSSW